MEKILLPTDFSDNSWNAIKYALQLFKHKECTFYLLNTYDPIIYHSEYALNSFAQNEVLDAVRKSSKDDLDKIKDSIQKEFNNPKHTIVCDSSFNSLVAQIQKKVEEVQINLIVMGTTGASGVKEILFGTNTIHVIQNVRSPVLAIPEKFDFMPPKEVLFPTDYLVSYKSNHLKIIVALAELFRFRLHVLHIRSDGGLTEIQEENKKLLKNAFRNSETIFYDIENDIIENGINEYQKKEKINFLIMLNNKHSFFENLFFKPVINQIGLHLNIPFLVIPTLP